MRTAAAGFFSRRRVSRSARRLSIEGLQGREREILKPDRVAVILQEDPAEAVSAESGSGELAPGKPLVPLRRADLNRDDPLAVEPMLDVVSHHDDLGVVVLFLFETRLFRR